MNGPTRLKNDPSFLQETGCDLRDEEGVIGDYQLGAMKQAVLSGRPMTMPTSARFGYVWWAVAGVAVVLLIAYQVGGTPTPVVVIPPLPSPPAHQAEVALPAPQQTAVSDAIVAVPSLDRKDALPGPTVRKQPVPDAAIAVASPERTSALAAELIAYDAAIRANDDGRWEDARQAWLNYRIQWPEGQLYVEGELALVQALVGLDDAAETERLVAKMLLDPRLAARRAELAIVRAEALLSLGRCDQALAQLETAATGGRTHAVRRACKRALKDKP
jgi:hypothetical protein